MKSQRLEAISFLQEQKNKKNSQNIIKLLNKISEIFFTEKTQKDYELALSLYFAEDENHVDKLVALEQKEPYNLRIKRALVLSYLQSHNCKLAKDKLTEMNKVTEYYKHSKELMALVYYCNKLPAPKNIVDAISEKDLKNFIEGANFYFKGQKMDAFNTWKVNSFYDTYLPSAFYSWQQEANESTKNQIGRRYIEKCQKITTSFKRNHFYFPYFCENKQKVAEELKSSHI